MSTIEPSRTDITVLMEALAIVIDDSHRPHVVVSYDPETGHWGASGPFRNRAAAQRHADEVQAQLNGPGQNDGALIQIHCAVFDVITS